MTEPLTPADCDLQDFPFMPLHVARLRDSDLASEEMPESCWYAVLLWAASWHQIPAASLPDNEAVLTKLIGLGRDVRTFRKHRAAAMRGFILCDDGRLYHPVVAEQAQIAWESKRQQRWRSECARIKKLNQRHHASHPLPTFDQFMSPDYRGPGPQHVPRDTTESPSGQSIQETETGTGILREEGSNDPSLSAGKPGRASGKGKASPIEDGFPDPPALAEADRLVAASGAKVDVADQARRFRSHARMNDRRLADWGEGWRAWIETEIAKAPKVAAAPEAEPEPWGGPSAVWDIAVARKGEAWARGYVGRCAWRDGALVTASPTIAKGIRQEIGREIEDIGYVLIQGSAPPPSVERAVA